jgi:hypothetical protein
MKNLVRLKLIGAVILFFAHPCRASSLTLSVVQDPNSHADLSALAPGQSVTFDANLSGLDQAGGQALGSLEGTVAFDGSLLGQPLSMSSGTIVPDPTRFFTAANPGVADATYYFGFSVSQSPITTNGTFFVFTVEVQPGASGSGVLSLDPSNGGFVAAFDLNDNAVDIAAGADLPFTVGGAAVPEPASFATTALGLAVVLAWSWRHHRRSRVGRSRRDEGPPNPRWMTAQ